MSNLDPVIQALAAERIRQGLTCAEVARRTGEARNMATNISRWESGEVVGPRLPLLRLWASALGLDIALVVRP